MAQAFITVYEKTYVWHDYRNRTASKKPEESVYLEAPKADIWLESVTSANKIFDNATDDDLTIFQTKLYRRRKWSTYQVSYCKKEIQKVEGKEEVKMADNELLEYGKNLYAEPTQKIMQPQPTARKLYGYLRPKQMYMQKSKYQETIGLEGYRILKRNYEASKKA